MAILQPTPEQNEWLKAHPQYMRTSHARAKFTQCGTLYPDGHFVRQSDATPVLDGNGAFGVGVLVPKAKRR